MYKTFKQSYYYRSNNQKSLNSHISGNEFFCIIQVVYRDLSILHEVVALHLAGEEQLVQHFLVSTSQELVEDVVASLSWLLRDHSGLLQKV